LAITFILQEVIHKIYLSFAKILTIEEIKIDKMAVFNLDLNIFFKILNN